MTRHARKPALGALLLTLAAGVVALGAAGQFRAPGGPASLSVLEKQIAGHPTADTWDAYGNALRSAGRPAAAAEAFQRALAIDPGRRLTRINAALALAESGNADGFFAYMSRLTMNDAKLASDLLARPEVAPLRSDRRYRIAADTAHAQSVD